MKAVGEYSWLLTFDDEEERRARRDSRAVRKALLGAGFELRALSDYQIRSTS